MFSADRTNSDFVTPETDATCAFVSWGGGCDRSLRPRHTVTNAADETVWVEDNHYPPNRHTHVRINTCARTNARSQHICATGGRLASNTGGHLPAFSPPRPKTLTQALPKGRGGKTNQTMAKHRGMTLGSVSERWEAKEEDSDGGGERVYGDRDQPLREGGHQEGVGHLEPEGGGRRAVADGQLHRRVHIGDRTTSEVSNDGNPSEHGSVAIGLNGDPSTPCKFSVRTSVTHT